MTRPTNAWTREPPDRPGWYWCRLGGSSPRIVYVYLGCQDQLPDAEWYGPLEPPVGPCIEDMRPATGLAAVIGEEAVREFRES